MAAQITTRLLLAGAAAGLGNIIISWVMEGWLFHGYQKRTPQTWRPEGPTQYTLSSVVVFSAGVLVALLFASVAPPAGSAFRTGTLFGVLAWLALPLPMILSISLFVNLHRGVILGLSLEWLGISVLSSIAAAWAVFR